MKMENLRIALTFHCQWKTSGFGVASGGEGVHSNLACHYSGLHLCTPLCEAVPIVMGLYIKVLAEDVYL